MATVDAVEPMGRRWTRDEFYRLAELGFFQDQRVELIEGVIYQMPAQKNLHSMGITLTHDALRAVFGPNYWVRVQMSLDLSPFSVPDPDLAVVAGGLRTHNPQSTPTIALLIVEVSETSLQFDRTRKMSLYAASGIEEYWILNLVDRQLEVYRNAALDSAQPYRFGYTSRTILDPADTVTPLELPNARIPVADMMP